MYNIVVCGAFFERKLKQLTCIITPFCGTFLNTISNSYKELTIYWKWETLKVYGVRKFFSSMILSTDIFIRVAIIFSIIFTHRLYKKLKHEI